MRYGAPRGHARRGGVLGTSGGLIEWSADAVPSVILSCLASHAAAKLFDGVERTDFPGSSPASTEATRPIRQRPLRGCNQPSGCLTRDPTTSPPPPWSPAAIGRCLVGRELDRHRARALAGTSPDIPGTPEYFPNSLLREHRRNLRRYLSGERDSYPARPRELSQRGRPKPAGAFRRAADLDRARSARYGRVPHRGRGGAHRTRLAAAPQRPSTATGSARLSPAAPGSLVQTRARRLALRSSSGAPANA